MGDRHLIYVRLYATFLIKFSRYNIYFKCVFHMHVDVHIKCTESGKCDAFSAMCHPCNHHPGQDLEHCQHPHPVPPGRNRLLASAREAGRTRSQTWYRQVVWFGFFAPGSPARRDVCGGVGVGRRCSVWRVIHCGWCCPVLLWRVRVPPSVLHT